VANVSGRVDAAGNTGRSFSMYLSLAEAVSRGRRARATMLTNLADQFMGILQGHRLK
jgi:hypothetical protein